MPIGWVSSFTGGNGLRRRLLLQLHPRIIREYKFPFWLARARIMQGWVLAEQGQTAEGIAGIRKGLDDWRATWARTAQPYFLAVLAEVYQKTGQIKEGLGAVTAGLEAAHKIGELVWEADLYRLKGELTLQARPVEDKRETSPRQVKNKFEVPNPQHPPPNTQAEAEAEAYFLKALGIARQQRAKLVELRAATSLSRLWRHQGKHEAARQLLTEIYNRFTEGFDTADLKMAKAVLDEIRPECR
jgi:predicted ATPase